MKQQNLFTVGFGLCANRTRKREFLYEMNLVVPFADLFSLVQPHVPAVKTGRLSFAVEKMLRFHFMQQWLGLTDTAMEWALHDVPLYCQFARPGPGMNRLSGKNTILRFRHLFEQHALSLQIMAAITDTEAKEGLMLKSCTVVDATLSAAPSSTTNKDGERDPKIHLTEKGNQWHFGMQAHIGGDADSGLVHNAISTAAKVRTSSKAAGYCTARSRWHLLMRAIKAPTSVLRRSLLPASGHAPGKAQCLE
jgi:IS5 family transposase